MLALSAIESAVKRIAPLYPIKRVLLFGSYASGEAHASSDVDVLVEFCARPITLLDYCGFQQELSETLNASVDIVNFPLSAAARSILDIEKVVPLYEKQG